MSKKLDRLLNQLMNLHPRYIDLSLNRLLNLLKKLGNPHHSLPDVIHIAGTNGKGSTLSYIRHILIENNLRVHAYISPHLEHFNERIILANKEIETKKLIKNLQYIKKINGNNSITFFEIITATAFYLFSKEKADFLILETGLGGRLDATNVIKKKIFSIITSIGIDHQEYLGKDILKITDEKLGIIKKNSNVIIAKQKSIVLSHIKKKLKEIKKNTTYIQDIKVIDKKNKTFDLIYKDKKQNFNMPKLQGGHQVNNLTTALIAILKINDLKYSFSKKKINNGIINTKWPGRLEEGTLGGIKVYLDGAHNLDGANQLLKFFKMKKLKTWLVIGMLNNKDINGYLKKIKPILLGVVSVAIPNEKNSYTADEIFEVCKNLKIEAFPKLSITQANNFLRKKIKPKIILISGSLYLVGKIRKKYL